MTIKGRMGYDAPRLTRDEGTELVVYHLRVAAAYYQLLPDDDNATLLEEIARAMEDQFEKKAAWAWAAVILAEYNSIKERD